MPHRSAQHLCVWVSAHGKDDAAGALKVVQHIGVGAERLQALLALAWRELQAQRLHRNDEPEHEPVVLRQRLARQRLGRALPLAVEEVDPAPIIDAEVVHDHGAHELVAASARRSELARGEPRIYSDDGIFVF